MLYKKTVEPTTLELLKSLLQLPELQEFALLGGTSLSLRWGHRKSEDLDLFSNALFDERAMVECLEAHYQDVVIDVQEKQTVRAFVNQVKVEIIAPKRPYLKPFEVLEDIRLFSVEDTMAFKMNAIERRGSKKDFYDLFECLKYHALEDVITFYQKKFETSNVMQLLKSITYFDDAENNPDPILFRKKTWESVKKSITKKFNQYTKNNL
jgi:predicted nucleotidyltransferase component of viral defense system